MKKFVVLILTVTAALCLTTVAYADAISGAKMLVAAVIIRLSTWLLVAAVVAVTIILLRKFRKK